MIESIAIVARWHNPRLQQMRTSLSAAARGTETKEKKHFTFERPLGSRDL